jgi:ADP-ribose pyrophosphatase YjhB (NUDIX family)
MMYRWLPDTEVCNIPPFAHTMIGVGAVVMNKAHEILVVREKYFLIPHWKLPGGYVEPGKCLSSFAWNR